jgi:hypothetical protein
VRAVDAGVVVNIFSGRVCPKIFEKNSSEFFECLLRNVMTEKGRKNASKFFESVLGGMLKILNANNIVSLNGFIIMIRGYSNRNKKNHRLKI